MQLQAKECWQPQRLEDKEQVLPESLQRERGHANTRPDPVKLVLDFCHPDLWNSEFLLF